MFDDIWMFNLYTHLPFSLLIGYTTGNIQKEYFASFKQFYS